MATNTTNYDLVKPAYSDTADIADINGNMDKVDNALGGIESGIAIVSKNNTHAAITAGQYVYVHGHGSLAEGLYTANSNIAANATLSSSNLTAAGGVLNTLKGGLNKITTSDYAIVNAYQNGNTSSTNVAKIYGSDEGGNLRLAKGLCHAEMDTNEMSTNANTGYLRLYVNDGTSTELTKVFKFNQNGSFTDGNGVGTKTLNDFRLIRAGANGVCSNALLINGNIDHEYNKPMRVNASTQYKPSDCSFGVREVIFQNANEGSLYCVIYGIDTSNRPAMWMNWYDTNSWYGWKKCLFS